MKRTAVLMTLILALLLSACGGKTNGGQEQTQEPQGPEYPVLELPDISGIALTDAQCAEVKFGYDAGKWTLGGDDPAMLYLNDTIENDSKVNLVVNYETDTDELTDKDLEDLKSVMVSDEMSFMAARAADFYTIGGDKVIFLDIGITDMEAYVDFIIESAGFSEEDIESMGGREAILDAMPATSQLMIYFVKDGHLFSASGIYFDDTQRQELLALFAQVSSTVEKV